VLVLVLALLLALAGLAVNLLILRELRRGREAGAWRRPEQISPARRAATIVAIPAGLVAGWLIYQLADQGGEVTRRAVQVALSLVLLVMVTRAARRGHE
jgi:hypothetical protein